MYRRIVANKIRATFREINAGNYQAMIDSLADSFQYRFHGSHALGGTRTRKKDHDPVVGTCESSVAGRPF